MGIADTYPLVSVIVPTHNRENYLPEAIDSVLQQTYTNWELIVADDQSTDNTVQIVRQLPDERIHLHLTPQRLGVTGTRNFGIKKAKGDLIAFIDSDDLWAPTKLQKQVEILAKYPDAEFCLTNGYDFREVNDPINFFYKQQEGVRYGDLFLAYFKSELSTTTPSFVFRRRILDSIEPFNEAKAFADVDFMLRIAQKTKGVVLYEPLFYRRLHNSNISKLDWEKGYREGIELIREYKKTLPSAIEHNALFRLHINFGEDYLLRNKKREAIDNFLLAWKNKPASVIPARKILKTAWRFFKPKNKTA